MRGDVREIDASSHSDLLTVGRLHLQLLAFGPMSALGERFVREICYRAQMRSGVLRVALYEVEGRAAGFVAYTDRSLTFQQTSLSAHWPLAVRLVLLAVLEDPRRMLALLTALRVAWSRRGGSSGPAEQFGEVVCLAVAPEYLTPDFVQRSGLRVSEELVTYGLGQLRLAGVDRARMIVDADNKPVLLLYHRLGATFEPYMHGGRRSVQVWFDLASR